jgi:hypothetical protein
VVLDEMENSSVTQVAPLKDEGLPHQVVGCVVEILRFKRRRVNGRKAWVGLGDDMLLYQLHSCPRSKVRMRPLSRKISVSASTSVLMEENPAAL